MKGKIEKKSFVEALEKLRKVEVIIIKIIITQYDLNLSDESREIL